MRTVPEAALLPAAICLQFHVKPALGAEVFRDKHLLGARLSQMRVLALTSSHYLYLCPPLRIEAVCGGARM